MVAAIKAFELADDEQAAIKPKLPNEMLPNAPRSVPWVNDRRVFKPTGIPSGYNRPPRIP